MSKVKQSTVQIDVEFIANTAKLVKELETLPKKANLDKSLPKDFTEGYSKNINNLLNDLSKLEKGLLKKGNTSKQTEAFFDKMNIKIQESSKFLKTLKQDLRQAFDNPINKQTLKSIDEYKESLKELTRLSTLNKAANTRRNTSVDKMKSETGLDYFVANPMLKKIQERKANKQPLTSKQQDWVKANGLDEKTLKRALDLLTQIVEQENKMQAYSSQAKSISGVSGVEASINSITGKLTKAENAVITKEDLEIFSKIISQAAPNIKAANDEISKLPANFESAEFEADRLRESTETIRDVLAQFGIKFSVYSLVQGFKEIGVAAFNFYKDLDAALNQIYVVSNLSIDAVNNLKTNFIQMAQDTGMAIDDITEAAVLFYQQGLNTDEVLVMTEVTSQFAKVAGTDAADAADKLTAAVNGYCLAAEDAALVADKFNQVAAVTAADIDELSTAFSKAAAQANQAGVSMDNYLAYIATMEEATREAPENIGTSLKTIFSRMQQIKTGENTEDDTEVNDVEKALKSVGIALRDTQGELRDLEEIFDELGPKWASLDRNTQAYLGTIIAGTRQQSRFITLMQNWDRVLEVSEESANSAGMQALMHAKAMDSIQSKLQQLQVAWQEFISKIGNSDLFKGVISSLTKLLKYLTGGKKTTALFAGALVLLSKGLKKLDSAFKKVEKDIKKWVSNFAKGIKSNKQMFSTVSQLNKNIEKEEEAIDKLNNANAKLTQRQHELADSGQQNSQEFRENITVLRENNSAIDEHNKKIQQYKQGINDATNGNGLFKQSLMNMQDSINGIAGIFFTLSTFFNGMASDMMSVAGGIALVVGAIVMGIKLIETTGKAAAEGLKQAERGSVILAIIQIALYAVSGLIAAIKGIKSLMEAFSVKDSSAISKSVGELGDKLEELSNAATKEKAAKRLLEQYQELANKIYLTSVEQEKLNDLAQQLGDSLGLEVIEDQYGNLTISIEEAQEKLEQLNREREEARKELIENELEQIEEYDNTGQVKEFYDKYLKSYKSSLRSAMGDIETGIDTKDLATSASNVEDIMNNLKNTIIEDSEELSDAFGGVGVHWTLTEDIQSAVDAFNELDIDSSEWNDLFRAFDVLKDQVDTMSYDKALSVVQGTIANWGEAAKLSATQIEQLTRSVMSSLYGSSNLDNSINKYKDIIDKSSGEYYDRQIKDLNKQIDDAYYAMDHNGVWDIANPFYESDEEREYEALKRKKSILEAQKKDVVFSDEEVENAEKMVKALENLSDASARAFDQAGLFDEDSYELIETMSNNGFIEKFQAAISEGNTEEASRKLTDELVRIIQETNDPELRAAAREKLDNVFNSISISKTHTWNDLGEELEGISDEMEKINSVMSEFQETGRLSIKTFSSLCDILTDMDLGALSDTGSIDKYIAALDNLQLGFDATTGSIVVNGESLQSLQDIEVLAAQTKLAATAASLEADKAELQSEIYGVEAEIEANTNLIEYLKTCGQDRIKISELAKLGNDYYEESMISAANKSQALYKDMMRQSSTWATASITNAAKVGEAIKKAMAGNLGSGNLEEELIGILSELDYEDTGSYYNLLANLEQDKETKVDVQAAIAELNSYNEKGYNTIKELQSKIIGIEKMQSLLTQMSQSDLSKLGLDVDSKELQEYIGELKEVYNIENKIKRESERINKIDKYMDYVTGDAWVKYYHEKKDLLNEQLRDYEQLTKTYGDMVEEEQNIIKNSPVGDVFKFDEFGNIIYDVEKYTQLQNKAIDGEETLMELADNLYDEYTELYDMYSEKGEEWIDKLTEIIELEQEQIENYIEVDEQAANTIKDILQERLDNKLDAIDTEIEALDRLQEKYNEVNEAANNSKELSNLQTSLKRSMMDTSGASNTKVLDYRDQIRSKLEEMGQDEYTKRLDDIKEALEDEKEALQTQFDEYFKDWTAFYEMVEKVLLEGPDAFVEIMKHSNEYMESSPIRRQQLVDEWYHQYTKAMVDLTGGKTISDVYNELQQNIQAIGVLDTHIKEYIGDGNDTGLKGFFSQAMAEYNQQVVSAVTTAVNNGKNSNNNTNYRTNYSTPDTDDETGEVGKITKEQVDLAKADNNKCTYTTWQNSTKGNQITTGLKKTGKYIAVKHENGKIYPQNIWDAGGGTWVYWKGSEGKYKPLDYTAKNFASLVSVKGAIYKNNSNNKALGTYMSAPFTDINKEITLFQGTPFKKGGMADFTGPAWLDGTRTAPEAVLNAAQTKAFMSLTNNLAKIDAMGLGLAGNNIVIDNISFEVASMSSKEDGERAFDAFVDRFKEIGSQSGLSFNKAKI